MMSKFCGNASAWSKVAFVLFFPALGFHCAGLGTVSWMKSHTISDSVHFVVGLWKMANCSGEYKTNCVDMAVPDNYNTYLMSMTKGTEITALALIVFSLILSTFYLLSPNVRIQKTAAWIMMLAYLEVGFSILGTVSWCLNMPDKHYVHWSLGLTIMAATICAVSATLMIPDIRRFDYDAAVLRKVERKKRRREKRSESRAEARTESRTDMTESLIKY